MDPYANSTVDPNKTVLPINVGPAPTVASSGTITNNPSFSNIFSTSGGQILGATKDAPNSSQAIASYGTPTNTTNNTSTGQTANNTDNNTITKDNLLSKFPGYAGWNLDAAWQNYLSTGGVGKEGGSNNSINVDEEYRLIDEAYNPQYSSLNANEATLGSNRESALTEAQNAFNTQQGLAKGQLTKAQGSLTDVATRGQQAYESALAQARSVYDQLQRGYLQRFGGSSSAGQAATEIGNVERLKQQGQSYKQLQDVNRQVELGKQDVQSQYDQNILQLEENKQKAIDQIQSDFRSRLDQINTSRGMLDSAKAQAKLAALQGLRQQVLQIQQQETQFKQQLQAMKYQADLQLDSYTKQLAMTQGNTTTNTQNAFNKLSAPVQTNLQTSVTNKSPMVDPYTGQIRTYSKDELSALGPYGYQLAR